MIPDLKTSADFPAFAMDVSEEALRAEESMRRMDDMAEHVMAYPPQIVTDGAGGEHIVLSQRVSVGQASDPWQITRRENQWFFTPGRIYTDPSDAEAVATITDAEKPLNIFAGGIVYLQLEGFPPGYTISLKSGAKWAGYPVTYEMSSGTNAGPPVLRYTRFLLATIFSEATPFSVSLGARLHAEYVRRSPDLSLIWGAHAFRDGSGRRATIPHLISL